MIVHEICNAITMVFPLISWLKNRRILKRLNRKSAFHMVMAFHMPISFLLHLCKGIRAKPKLCKVIFSLDILCIHITSIIASREISKKVCFFPYRIPCVVLFSSLTSMALHSYTLMYSILNSDLPSARFLMFFYDNYKLIKDKTIVVNGLISFVFYRGSLMTNLPYGHAIFHALLYNVYDEYFKLYYKTLPKQALASSLELHPF